MSLPVRGAWIEIRSRRNLIALAWSLPVRGAWIEIVTTAASRPIMWTSLPVRGAWIEIIRLKFVYKYQNVAPRKGSVD